MPSITAHQPSSYLIPDQLDGEEEIKAEGNHAQI